MKKALIWNEGDKEGQLFMIMEASRADKWQNPERSKMVLVDVPADIEDLDSLDMLVTYNEISEQYEIDLDPIKDKTKRIGEKYQEMNDDIYAQMAVVFGTNSPESATAYKETFSLMLADPSDYASLGLTARFDIGDINAGDVLDSEQKITDYATGKINDIKAYGVFRMQRIEQFKSEKAAIEAE